MNTNYTFDEITAKIIARGSKASKIEWLTKEAGFDKEAAESTYALIMRITPREAPTRRQRRERREAIFEVMHFTVGVEIECVNVNRARIRQACAEHGISTRDDFHNYNHSDSNDTYKLMSDSSLQSSRGDRYPTCEIVSPVLNTLESLKTVCDIINEAGAKANSSCGLHVHFGASSFSGEVWRRVILNYARIEDIIDSFMPQSRRASNSCWCGSVRAAARRIELYNYNDYRSIRNAIGTRYSKVNLESFTRHNTIEFRQHGGTTNFEKIEKWINFLAAFLTWTINHEDLLTATTIDELPFLNAEQKRFFNGRRTYFANRAA